MIIFFCVVGTEYVIPVSCSMPGCMFPVSRSYGPVVVRGCVLKFCRYRRLHLPKEGTP